MTEAKPTHMFVEALNEEAVGTYKDDPVYRVVIENGNQKLRSDWMPYGEVARLNNGLIDTLGRWPLVVQWTRVAEEQ